MSLRPGKAPRSTCRTCRAGWDSAQRAAAGSWNWTTRTSRADGREVSLEAVGEVVDYGTPGANPLLGLYSAYFAELYAADQVNIGLYLERASNTYRQSRCVAVLPERLLLGHSGYSAEGQTAYSRLLRNSGAPADTTYSIDMEATDQMVVRIGDRSTPTGFMGLYSGNYAELWAFERVMIGAFQKQNSVWHQTNVAVVNASEVILGGCGAATSDTHFPASTYGLTGVGSTVNVQAWASEFISLITCGATGPASASDPCVIYPFPYPPASGDIVIWAKHDLILGADGNIRVHRGLVKVAQSAESGISTDDWSAITKTNNVEFGTGFTVTRSGSGEFCKAKVEYSGTASPLLVRDCDDTAGTAATTLQFMNGLGLTNTGGGLWQVGLNLTSSLSCVTFSNDTGCAKKINFPDGQTTTVTVVTDIGVTGNNLWVKKRTLTYTCGWLTDVSAESDPVNVDTGVEC